MKKSAILMILCSAILAACHVNATDSMMIDVENRAVTTPIVTPTPTSSPMPTVSAMPKLKEKFDIHSKIGIVDVISDEPSCLRTKNGDLAEKTPVSIIVFPDRSPTRVFTATVGKKLGESCGRQNSEDGDDNPGENFFYTLELNKKELNEKFPEFFGFAIGFGVIEPSKPVKVQSSLASLDLNEDGKPEFFRFCQSSEGFHMTIWAGKPLIGKRIWHSYYYVDYGTVVTCKQKDWEETED